MVAIEDDDNVFMITIDRDDAEVSTNKEISRILPRSVKTMMMCTQHEGNVQGFATNVDCVYFHMTMGDVQYLTAVEEDDDDVLVSAGGYLHFLILWETITMSI